LLGPLQLTPRQTLADWHMRSQPIPTSHEPMGTTSIFRGNIVTAMPPLIRRLPGGKPCNVARNNRPYCYGCALHARNLIRQLHHCHRSSTVRVAHLLAPALRLHKLCYRNPDLSPYTGNFLLAWQPLHPAFVHVFQNSCNAHVRMCAAVATVPIFWGCPSLSTLHNADAPQSRRRLLSSSCLGFRHGSALPAHLAGILAPAGSTSGRDALPADGNLDWIWDQSKQVSSTSSCWRGVTAITPAVPGKARASE